MRALLLAAAALMAAAPLRADTATRHEPVWSGAAWAVVPAAVDWQATSTCISHGKCAEASLAGGTRAWTAITMTTSVAVQTWVDYEMRKRGHRGWAWALRGVGVLWHGWLTVNAYRLDHRAVTP